MSAAARARLAARVAGDYAAGGHRTVFVPDLNDVAAVGNEVAGVGTASLSAQAAAEARAAEALASANAALQAKQQAEAAVNSVTVGSTSSLAYPEVVKNLATAADVVDVVVYDARRDSDGGAWTERGQDTGWYNEALNTATRGPKRAFPKTSIAVLRSGATGTLTLYDALALDGSGVPNMWRVAARAAAGIIDGTPTSVFPLAGKIWVASSTGLYMLDFPGGRAVRWDASGRTVWSGGLTATGGYGGNVAAGAIVSSACIHVHARVLPGAPLDPVSGLPIPTVAVATAAGVSVIHPDERVCNITGLAAAKVFIGATSELRISASNNTYVAIGPVPYAATVAEASWRSSRLGGLPISTVQDLRVLEGATSGLVDIARSSSGGISFLDLNRGKPDTGMVAYATREYATGWQPGDIRLATLCDGAVGAIAGSGELVSNGAFPSNLTGWTAGTGWAHSSGTATKTAGVASALTQDVVTVIGQTYLVAAGITRSAGTLTVTAAGATLGTFSASGRLLAQFTAVATTTTLSFAGDASFAGTVDNVSALLAVADRSYRSTGLNVVGSLTRAAVNTGNDLAAWSGFSASNYLEQPYNPNLDFGTGDFCVAGWVNNRGFNSEALVERRAYSGGVYSGTGLFITVTVGVLILRIMTGAGITATVTSTTDPRNAGWLHVVGLRRNGVLELWINGRLESTVANTTDLTNTSAKLVVGLLQDGTNDAAGSDYSLLRVSAYAPTPAQIAKMYADERPLFDLGARAFLGGTSNSVAGLSYSEMSRRLAVATGDGVSIFAGLRRVEYLDGATTPLAIASDTMRAVGMEGGVLAFGTAANAGARRDAITGLDRMPAAPVGLATLRRLRASGVTTDATPLALAPRVHIGERETVMIEARIVGRVYGASDSERLTYVRRGVYYRQAGGNVTLQGSVQTIGTDTETTAGADATLLIDTTAQTITPQVTGVAATRIVWSSDIRVQRISEGTQYEETM